MFTNSVTKLCVLCVLSLLPVNGWDGLISESSSQDYLNDLRNYIDNLKQIVTRPSLYDYGFGHRASWPYNVYTETENDRYTRMRERYILPILNSLKDISEEVKIAKEANSNSRIQPMYIPIPVLNISNGNDIVNINNHFMHFYTQPHYYNSIISAWRQSMLSNNRNGNGNIVPSFPQFSDVGSDSKSSVPSSHQHHDIGSGYRQYTPSNQLPLANPLPINVGRYKPSNTKTYSDPVPSKLPSIAHRYPLDFEEDQNWGLVKEIDKDSEDENTRPIILKNVNTTESDCNCEQINKKNATPSAPFRQTDIVETAITCKAVLLSCCIPGITEQQRINCFMSQGCIRSYETGLACLPIVIRQVFHELYGKL